MAVLRESTQKLELLRSTLWPYRTGLLVMLPLMVFKNGLEALMAIALLPLFDQVLGTQSTEEAAGMIFEILANLQRWLGTENTLLLSSLLLIALAALSAVAGLGLSSLCIHVLAAFERDRRNDLFKHLMQLDWLYYLNQRAGHAINNITVEVIRSRQWFDNAIRLTDGVISILLYVAAAAYVSPIYILITAIALSLLGTVMFPILWKVKKYGAQLVTANQDLMQHLSEFISGFKVVKGSVMETIAQRLVEQRTRHLHDVMLRSGFLRAIPNSTLQPAALIAAVGLIYLVHSRQLGQISELAVVALLLLRTFQRLTGLQSQWVALSERLSSFSLVAQLPGTFVQHQEAQPTSGIEYFESLVLRNVSFAYRADRLALRGVNLKIKRGEFVGIVGGSGAGKTTLVDLILLLIKPTSGDILVNGLALKNFNPQRWRTLIGYVPQDTILFNDTITNNITLQRQSVTMSDVVWAARIADADEFIRSFPDGYETTVGDRGARISGGQRQRLALARALAGRPQLLLLDEATSSLDSVSEQRIQEAVEGLRGQLTIIVVAHRVSTVMGADRIIVLDQGRVVEEGVPKDLAKTEGRFRELYTLQTMPELA